MAIIEIDNPQVEHQLSIDPVFDDDHWICCDLPEGFVGITYAFCGAETMEWEPECGGAVSCVGCNAKAASDYMYCPVKGKCTHINVDKVLKP